MVQHRLVSDEATTPTDEATTPASDKPDEGHAPPQAVVEAGPLRRSFAIAEDTVYYLTAVLLTLGAAAVLVEAVIGFAQGLGEPRTASLELLDSLLIIFIFAELLYAVRITVASHELSAEPFLIVGILAAIKEIVVLSLKVSTGLANGPEFARTITGIGVLAGVVFALGVAILVLRRPKDATAT